jgi:hypothetical protein
MVDLRHAVRSPEDGALALLMVLWGRSPGAPAWYGRAACRDADPELFAGDDETGEARALCAVCPVRRVCLAGQDEYELRRPKAHRSTGVFGGLTGAERMARRARMAEIENEGVA